MDLLQTQLTSQSTGRLTVVHVFAKTKSAKTAPTYAPVFEALYGKSMLIVDELRITLAKALDDLYQDEWAVVQWRDDAIAKIDSIEAFDSILPTLELALEQTDGYAFESCCSLALQFASVAQTTEQPENLVSVLQPLRKHELQLAINSSKVKELERCFRVSKAI
jgi:hypothetical protein